jgi:amino acid permease
MYVLLLLAKLICHKSSVVHTQYFYIAGSGHVAQQHTEYIVVCPQQQWLHQHATTQRYMYIADLGTFTTCLAVLMVFNGLADTDQTWQKFHMTKINHFFVFYKSLSLIMPTWQLCKLSWRDQHQRSLCKDMEFSVFML